MLYVQHEYRHFRWSCTVVHQLTVTVAGPNSCQSLLIIFISPMYTAAQKELMIVIWHGASRGPSATAEPRVVVFDRRLHLMIQRLTARSHDHGCVFLIERRVSHPCAHHDCRESVCLSVCQMSEVTINYLFQKLATLVIDTLSLDLSIKNLYWCDFTY